MKYLFCVCLVGLFTFNQVLAQIHLSSMVGNWRSCFKVKGMKRAKSNLRLIEFKGEQLKLRDTLYEDDNCTREITPLGDGRGGVNSFTLKAVDTSSNIQDGTLYFLSSDDNASFSFYSVIKITGDELLMHDADRNGVLKPDDSVTFRRSSTTGF